MSNFACPIHSLPSNIGESPAKFNQVLKIGKSMHIHWCFFYNRIIITSFVLRFRIQFITLSYFSAAVL